ncbi:MAG TPA: VOC family protein [Candidatus Sulfotelmatobacter sp.]|jgi:catechol 2,3-dioxygenase-like lactoylglutathione lyase family enzyme|nr:VOC family protein [Candidatus Sulfotelmatobacter sp.]
MLKKIDHINIVVRDLENAKQFFLDMGFIVNVSKEGELEGSWIEQVTKLKNAKGYYCTLSLPNAQTTIELIHYDNPKDQDDPLISKPNHVGIRHIAFEVEDIKEIVSTLKAKGRHFFSEIQEYKATKKQLCYFLGPEGIVLELAEYAKK